MAKIVKIINEDLHIIENVQAIRCKRYKAAAVIGMFLLFTQFLQDIGFFEARVLTKWLVGFGFILIVPALLEWLVLYRKTTIKTEK